MDFLENGSNDFAQTFKLDAANGYLAKTVGPIFWKNLDLELWIDLCRHVLVYLWFMIYHIILGDVINI